LAEDANGIPRIIVRQPTIVANESGHNIEIDQPEAAVGAIEKMLEVTRSGNGWPQQLASGHHACGPTTIGEPLKRFAE
jgi:hypothetical protein